MPSLSLSSLQITLILSIFGAIAVSGLATAALRSASAELPVEPRERIYRAQAKWLTVWSTLEWGGVLLIILSLWTRYLSAHRYLYIAGGMALLCLANAASAWHASILYNREAPLTNASRSANRAALLVTLAEIALLCVVVFFVGRHIGWFKDAKTPRAVDEISGQEESSGVWLPESVAFKELNWLKPDEIKAIGNLRTKNAGGKTVYNSDDVERLKREHIRNAELPE